MKPIKKRSVESQTTDAVRAEIVSGRLSPGERLTEMQLASQLVVSRATVRTALHHLTSEGLVVQVPYTGWAVASLTPADAWELFTLRASLESLAARLAATKLDEKGRADLQLAFQRLCDAAQKGNAHATAEADFGFHEAIVGISGHRRLAQQYRLVEQQVRQSIASSNALLPDLCTVIEQHEPIIQAILGNRPKLAARLSEEHAQTEGEKLAQYLEQEVTRKTGAVNGRRAKA
ncbi:MAG TPA: GntR family transcriptional regulator [Hyphomicrobiaceae bacterium]|jgi:DNA-binding GntR family transcriptional regulator|nr:GntR family transcriptional regulator [Hyphomicrobiaceae bacterium]